jgi:uncharacterized repeat protein (TIGR01451 family)
VRIHWLTKDRLEFGVNVDDSLSNGLTFQQLLDSSVSADGVPLTNMFFATRTATGVTFGLTNALVRDGPPVEEIRTFTCSIKYAVTLNDLSIQSQYQTNRAQITVLGFDYDLQQAGTPIVQMIDGVRITDSTPALECEQLLSSSTGLPGDERTITIVARNTGNVFLTNLWIDALVPNDTTFVPNSLNPPATAIVPNPIIGGIPLPGRTLIRWQQLPDLATPGSGGSSLGVSYGFTLDSGLVAGSNLVGQAFVTAQGPLISVSNYFATLNCVASNVSLVVSSSRVGLSLSVTPDHTNACPLDLITYSVSMQNTGDFPIANATLRVYPGTLPVVGNPSFPMEFDSLAPGESTSVTYKGQVGLFQKGTLTDYVLATGSPLNNGVLIAAVGNLASASVTVLPPVLSKITPASAPQGSTNLELTIEGACFVPGTIIGFQPSDGIEIIPPPPPDYGFVGSTELRQKINISADAPLGQREVFVLNPNGDGGGTRPSDIFTITVGGTNVPVLQVSPTTLDFGQTTLGQSKDLTLTIQNQGTAPLVISSIVTGNPQFWEISPALPFTVAPGAQQPVTIRFTPSGAGAQNLSLAITSNDPKQATLSVTLLGSGLSSNRSAQAQLNCLSLLFQRATASSGNQNFTLDLTSLGAPPPNGELYPTFDPLDFSHTSDFTLAGSGFPQPLLGSVFLDVPTLGDSNNNGLDDFFESAQSVPSTTTDGEYDSATDFGTIQATWSRSSGSITGSCILQLTSDTGLVLPQFTATFKLLEYGGSLTYTPGSNTVTASIQLAQSQNASNTLFGPILFSKEPTNRFNLLNFTSGNWTNQSAQVLGYIQGSIQRNSKNTTNYAGAVEFLDGDLTTPDPDYLDWRLVINDTNDSNANGIPDLSDDPVPITGAPRFTSASLQSGQIVLLWVGNVQLQAADQITGPWSDVLSASSPYRVSTTGSKRFFRLVQ